ncbi:MAG: DUF6163 family protein [Notoacmeibacter sp.]|nr:DUF6163 family protein [Notoacmeibacter sp.]
MKEEAVLRVLRPTLAENGLVWLSRVVAGYSLLFGILYWIRLIGFFPGQLWRFDLMPVHWQVAAISLAVLYPFAAIGLWTLASWGPVVWFICAAGEIAMYGVLTDMFGVRSAIVVSHLAIAMLYGVFKLVIWLQRRERHR